MIPKQQSVIQQHLNLLKGSVKVVPLKCLQEIMDMAQLECCPACDGEKGHIFAHHSGKFEDIFRDCKQCNGTGMIKIVKGDNDEK